MLDFDFTILADASIWIRIIVALICGFAIGWEREAKHKAAGLRTTMLICLGATLYMLAGELIAKHGTTALDPTRIAGQVVTGIGFLGAGVIIHRGMSIHGLTTAATVWASAAIGVLIGAGYPLLAMGVSAIIVLVLLCTERLEKRIFKE